MRRLPSKLIRLIVGYSTTVILSVLPRGSKSTLSKSPEATSRCKPAFNSPVDNVSPCTIPARERIAASPIRAFPSMLTELIVMLCAKATLEGAIQATEIAKQIIALFKNLDRKDATLRKGAAVRGLPRFMPCLDPQTIFSSEYLFCGAMSKPCMQDMKKH